MKIKKIDSKQSVFLEIVKQNKFSQEEIIAEFSIDGDQQYYLFTTSPSTNSSPGYYLVDNQGYDYPRYITRLWGYAKDEVVTGMK